MEEELYKDLLRYRIDPKILDLKDKIVLKRDKQDKSKLRKGKFQ